MCVFDNFKHRTVVDIKWYVPDSIDQSIVVKADILVGWWYKLRKYKLKIKMMTKYSQF